MLHPSVETERLLLRPLREADLDAYAEMLGDPEFARYIGTGETVDRVGAWRNIATMLGHWHLRGFGFWAIERKSDGLFLGRAGLLYPEGWPGVEVGWGITPQHWGQGYATEAGAAGLRFGFEELGLEKLISLYRPENSASLRVGEKLGETFESETEMMGGPVVTYAITREQWQQTQSLLIHD